MRSRIARSLFVFLIVGAACTDTTDTTAPRRAVSPGAANHTSSVAPSLDAVVTALIDTAFAGGPQGNAARARWEDVKRKLAGATSKNGPSAAARQTYLNYVSWLQGANMSPSNGESAAHIAARLILYVSLYVYGGPGAAVPIVTAASDAAVGVVTPTAVDTIRTPTKHAGVAFPAGAVSEPTVMVVAQEAQPYPANCTGPLVTRYCQYPQFYRFNAFPDVKLNKAASVSVCHVHGATARAPLADHDRFLLAHDKPSDPANYAPGSTIIDSVEILALVRLPGLADCTGTTYSMTPARLVPPRRGLPGFADRVLRLASRATKGLGALVSPQPLYAIDQGGGGMVSEFSNFNVIDPQSSPDLVAGPLFSVSAATALPGATLGVHSWSVSNAGTATAGSFATGVVMATDSALTQGVVTLSSTAAHPSLVPGATWTDTAQVVTVPTATPPGVYFVGVQVSVTSSLQDANLANNTVSARVTVTSPTPPPPQEPTYSLLNLSTAAGAGWAEANAINNAGRIVGIGGHQFADWQGWVWQPGMTTIMNLPNPCGDWYYAFDVNAAGSIAMSSAYCGWVFEPGPSTPWMGNIVTPPAASNRPASSVVALNDLSLVLVCGNNGQNAQNYVWDRNTGSTTLVTGAYNNCAGRINNAGQAVVSVTNIGPSELWDQAAQTATPVPLLPPGYGGTGIALNQSGIVVGSSIVVYPNTAHAFRWIPGQANAEDLGTLGGSESAALGINSGGTIVGWSTTASGARHAFVWNPSTRHMTDLGTLPNDTESRATAINDNGVIVGSSGAWRVSSTAVRWTPNP